MNEIKSGLRAILSIPAIYNTFQWMVGTPRMRRHVIEGSLQIPKPCKLLDIGCGPGELRDYFPDDVEYIGLDKDADCIAFASKKYGDRATFLNVDVNDLKDFRIRENEYDIVLMFCVFHHLNDSEVEKVLEMARYGLKPTGIAISADGVYLQEQSRAAKYFLSKDRGQYVRTDDAYLALVRKKFEKVEVKIERGLLRIPTDMIVMTMTK
jgi:SAM-dependent methyltransferase